MDSAPTPHRVTIVALSMAWLGDRVVVRGATPDPATRRLAAALRADGMAVEEFRLSGPRTVRGVARAVATRAPETIVARLVADTSATFARIWIGALRAESPDARIVLVSDGVAPAGLDVDARALIDDDGIGELIRSFEHARPGAPLDRRVLDADRPRRIGTLAPMWR